MMKDFTHWLVFPDTTEYSSFAKAVFLDRHSDRQKMIDLKIQILNFTNINKPPFDLPTKPEYKVSSQPVTPQTVQ